MSVDVSVPDFAAWRSAARQLLLQGCAPADVQWQDASYSGGAALPLFLAEPVAAFGGGSAQGSVRMSRAGLAALESAAMYRDPARWALLYRILWRFHHGDRSALSPADEDGAKLASMAKAVGREIHKMHAFVRFRERPAESGGARFVAWYEPVHHVIEAAAPHFLDRMGEVPWLIATPYGTAASDGRGLVFGAPVPRPPEADDQGEALWLAYYRSTFNPSRVNARAMTREMPVRYWKNLPEGRLVPGLLAHADAGAQRLAQDAEVARREGTTLKIDALRAMPRREAPGALDECRRCDLWRHATQGVAGAGPADAAIMVVGEQPGDVEDLEGRPFAGPAGQLLDRAFAAANVERGSVYLTNAVKHFKWEPRGKRRLHKTPGQREIEACMHWLDQETRRADPAVIVAMGATAAKAVRGVLAMPATAEPLADLLGRVVEHDGRRVIFCWHPAYVLRVSGEAAKAEAFEGIVAALRTAAALSGTAEGAGSPAQAVPAIAT